MDQTVIYQTGQSGLRPLEYKGKLVFTEFSELRKLLMDKLGEAHADLFTEPMISEDTGKNETEIIWISDRILHPKPLSFIEPPAQIEIKERLAGLISEIETLSASLKESGIEDERNSGELLEKALVIPGLHTIFADGNQIRIAGWGFCRAEAKEPVTLSDRLKDFAVTPPEPETVEPPPVGRAKIRIRLVDSEEKPVSGIQVTAFVEGASAETITDRHGKAAFPKVPVPSEVRIIVDLPDREPFEETIRCEKDGTEQTVILPTTLTQKTDLTFMVTNSDGKGLKGLKIQLACAGETRNDLTDEEGTSHFPGIPVGENVKIKVKSPRHKKVEIQLRAEDSAEPRVIVMEPLVKRRFPKYKAAVILFLAAGLFFLGRTLFREPPLLPEEPGFMPFSADRITPAPEDPLGREIISDNLMILLGKNVNIREFAKDFKDVDPGRELRFIGFLPEFHLLQVAAPPKLRDEWKGRIETLPQVDAVLYDYVMTIHYMPNDPGFQDNSEDSPFSLVGAFSAWDMTTGHSGIVVAVLDTGFDIDHPELKGKIVHPMDVLKNEPEVSARVGQMNHGTHTASIAVGYSDNGHGVSGICPECSLMPVRIADDKGILTTSSVLSGLFHAFKKGADVICLPAGMKIGAESASNFAGWDKEKKSAFLEQVRETTRKERLSWDLIFQTMTRKNAVLVQSAGNDALFSELDPMKDSSYALNAGAFDADRKPADFSNYGEAVNVCAPGVSVFNAVADGKYGKMSGTSMAAAMTAGAVGMVKSEKPGLSAADIRTIIMESGEEPPEGRAKMGRLLKIDAALEKAAFFEQNQCRCTSEIEALREEIRRLEKAFEQLAP